MHIDEVHAYQREKDDLMRNSYRNFRGDNMPIYADQGEDSRMPRRKQAEYGNSHELLQKT